MKIVHETEKCIGCGACTVVCPKYWKMGDDGKAHLLNSKINPDTKNEELEIKETECNREAVNVCPVQCIHIQK
ncbi:ferredoxin [bacterium]|nr:ferredoxin [bacterium]